MGCLVGVGVWIAFFMAFYVLYAIDEARYDQGGLSGFWFWPVLALPPVGYLVAVVATVRRPSRHFGQGMLLGLTGLLLVGFAVAFLIFQATPT
jgi:hypothetical protein